MMNTLFKLFIRDHENHMRPNVRAKYGFLASIISIILNGFMAGLKITIGFFTNSVSILADGLNNLSDIASSFAVLVGFTFAMKNPDKEHPFGHGRSEYLIGLSISVLILIVGIQMIRDSIHHILNPKQINFSWVALIVLLSSIILKYILGIINTNIGNKIMSPALIAAGRDSKIDIIATVATLTALISSLITDLPIDGVLGVIVSLLIIKTGFEIAKEAITSILGMAPDQKLLDDIKNFITKYDRILGTHDLMIHDYGPGRRYLTLHVEVDKKEDLMDIHEVIDEIERDIVKTFSLNTTIHLDPVDLDDELTQFLRLRTNEIIKNINNEFSLHDFRVRHCNKGTTLIFDVAIPADDKTPHKIIITQIDEEIKNIDNKFFTLIQIDHNYS